MKKRVSRHDDRLLEIRRMAELIHHIIRYEGGRARESWIKRDIQACEVCKALKMQNPKTIHKYLKLGVEKGILRHIKDPKHKLSVYEVVEPFKDRFWRIKELLQDHWREFIHARRLGKFFEEPKDSVQLIQQCKSFLILRWCRILRRMLTAKSPKYVEDLFRRNKSLMHEGWQIIHHLASQPQETQDELKKELLAAIMDEEQRQLLLLTISTWKIKYDWILELIGDKED